MGNKQSNDKSESETLVLNKELELRHFEFVSNCNEGKGDPSACHSYGEWLAAVDENYTKAGIEFTYYS